MRLSTIGMHLMMLLLLLILLPYMLIFRVSHRLLNVVTNLWYRMCPFPIARNLCGAQSSGQSAFLSAPRMLPIRIDVRLFCLHTSWLLPVSLHAASAAASSPSVPPSCSYGSACCLKCILISWPCECCLILVLVSGIPGIFLCVCLCR